MSKRIVKKKGLEEIIEMVRELDFDNKLKLISKIADELSRNTSPKRPKAPIASYGFCGMWKDREDMRDSIQWVRDGDAKVGLAEAIFIMKKVGGVE